MENFYDMLADLIIFVLMICKSVLSYVEAGVRFLLGRIPEINWTVARAFTFAILMFVTFKYSMILGLVFIAAFIILNQPEFEGV